MKRFCFFNLCDLVQLLNAKVSECFDDVREFSIFLAISSRLSLEEIGFGMADLVMRHVMTSECKIMSVLLFIVLQRGLRLSNLPRNPLSRL